MDRMSAVIDLRAAARRSLPHVPRLPALRTSAENTWRGRMLNEYASAAVFEALAAQLARAGLEQAVVRQCRGFADEERRHAALCGAVVEALDGHARAELPARKAFPEHADASPLEAALRNLLSISCLSETVAVALIGAERLEMPSGELRELLTSIWADEIGHARFGWRLVEAIVPELAGDTRVRLGRYLAIAFAHLEAHELAHLPVTMCPPPEGTLLGLCNGQDARRLFYETVEHVIVPSLEGVGLEARRAWQDRTSVPEAR
jgi:hypothetical protein